MTNIANQDELTFSVAVNMQMSEYSVNIIDIYQMSAWTLAGDKSSSNGDVKGTITNNLISGNAWSDNGYSANGFAFKGTVDYVNTSLANSQRSLINQSILDDLKLNYSMLPGFLPIMKVNTAISNIEKAYQELNSSVGAGEAKKSLTYKQMQYAIVNSGRLLTSNID